MNRLLFYNNPKLAVFVNVRRRT